MSSRFAPLALLVIIGGIYAAQVGYFYPLIPDRIATHFGPTGHPDGWMQKLMFVETYGLLLAFITLIDIGSGYLIAAVPNETINLPNKDYWLSPERRPATMAFLKKHMLYLSGATAALMLVVVQGVFRANLSPEPHLQNGVWVLLGVFCVFMGFWPFSLLRRFHR